MFARQRGEGEARLADSGAALEAIVVAHAAEMSYIGQIHALRVPVESGWSLERIVEAFETVYRAEYGATLGEIPKAVVSLKTSVSGARTKPAAVSRPAGRTLAATPASWREVYFGGWTRTPIYLRRDLQPDMTFGGPAIIEQPDTTSLIEPGMKARVDALDNILAELA